MCRLNFDAIQVGGTAPDPCAATAAPAGAARLFDGTFASFDQWRKAGGGGFGHQTDCTIRGFRGPGSTWTQTSTSQQADPYTLDARLEAPRRRRRVERLRRLGHQRRREPHHRLPREDRRLRHRRPSSSADGAFTQAADAAALAAAVKPVGQWNRYAVQVTPAAHPRPPQRHGRQRRRPGGRRSAASSAWRTAATAAQVDFRDIQVQPGRRPRPDGRPGEARHEGGRHHAEPRRRVDPRQPRRRGPALGDPRHERRHRPHRVRQPDRAGGRPGPDRREPHLRAGRGGRRRRAARRTCGSPARRSRPSSSSSGRPPRAARCRARPSSASAPRPVSRGPTTPAAPQGDRITGIWLDGAALNPAGNYSVTVSQSLAAGGDNFRAFTEGLVPQVRQATTVSALAAYIGDASTARSARRAAVPARGRRPRPGRCPVVLRRRHDVRRRPQLVVVLDRHRPRRTPRST